MAMYRCSFGLFIFVWQILQDISKQKCSAQMHTKQQKDAILLLQAMKYHEIPIYESLGFRFFVACQLFWAPFVYPRSCHCTSPGARVDEPRFKIHRPMKGCPSLAAENFGPFKMLKAGSFLCWRVYWDSFSLRVAGT